MNVWCRRCRMRDIYAAARMRIDALNHALRDIPEERSRYHICWG